MIWRFLWRFIDTLYFAVKSAALAVVFGVVLVGFSCFRHGDVGPYPEVDYLWVVPIVAMLIVYTTEGERCSRL